MLFLNDKFMFLYSVYGTIDDFGHGDGTYLSIKESSTFRNGIIFIDDEIVAPVWNEDNSPSKSYPIVNLKTWDIVHEFNRDSGLIFRGDYANEPDIFYDVDTTYLKGNAIKFVYSENKRDYDEISGISNYTTIHKYAYSIDTNTYDIVFEGKIE